MRLEIVESSQKRSRVAKSDEDLADFIELVREGRDYMFGQVVTITLPIARWLLDRNEANRTLNDQKIKTIAKDILGGRWHVNGQAIIVSADGLLNDGQNRLHGIILAGKSVDSFVSFGVSRQSRDSVDDIRPRNVGNFLQMRGVANARTISAIVALYEVYSSGAYYRTINQASLTLSKQDMLAAYDKRPTLFDKAAAVARDKFLATLGPSSVGTAYVILHESKKDSVDYFFERLSDGAGMEKGNPILTLRNRLSTSDERLFAHERLELILRTWNAYIRGEKIMQSPKLLRKYPELAK